MDADQFRRVYCRDHSEEEWQELLSVFREVLQSDGALAEPYCRGCPAKPGEYHRSTCTAPYKPALPKEPL